jgi:hypothetical protein
MVIFVAAPEECRKGTCCPNTNFFHTICRLSLPLKNDLKAALACSSIWTAPHKCIWWNLRECLISSCTQKQSTVQFYVCANQQMGVHLFAFRVSKINFQQKF